jgi:hypothetical protein
MNSTFVGYVTSTAFNLSLSKKQVWALLAVRAFGRPRVQATEGGNWYTPVHALIGKGLVWHTPVKPADAPKNFRHYGLTAEGELVCKLLDAAGLALPDDIAQAAA